MPAADSDHSPETPLQAVTPAPTVGGLFTIRNGIKAQYPFVESIVSALPLCDRVLLVDGGSTDGTLQVLKELAATYPTVELHQQVELSASQRHGVIDGQLYYGFDELADMDWIFEIQADEIWHPDLLPAVGTLITTARAAGARSVRMRRQYGISPNESITLVTVRHVENHPQLGTWSGGDSFTLPDEAQPDPKLAGTVFDPPTDDSYTKHNVQPEYQTDLFFTHTHEPVSEFQHKQRHALWLSRDNDARCSDYLESVAADDIDTESAAEVPVQTSGKAPDTTELFGGQTLIAQATTKSAIVGEPLERQSDTVHDGPLVDRQGNEYDHGLHTTFDDGDMAIHNDTSRTGLGTAKVPFSLYDPADMPTYDTESIFFDPEAMTAATDLPYHLLADY